jgi:alanine-glyoxylate transaminase/serine-glyoxylate transaminase/serine-pyruvate transaminase
MAGRNFLFVPGPTNIPDRVMRAMMVSMEDHRSPSFPAITREIMPGLKKLFRTEHGSPFVFPSSGTGCWEAAVTNTLSPGDRVLAARFGQFSHLWIEMCTRIGLDVQIVDCEWGTGVPLQQYAVVAFPELAALIHVDEPELLLIQTVTEVVEAGLHRVAKVLGTYGALSAEKETENE